MKTLPPLTLDLTRATLERRDNFVELIDPHERTVARIFAIDGDYDHACIILDRLSAYQTLVNNLRALAIVDTMAPAQNAVVKDGHRCRVCASTWKLNQSEHHQNWCALKGTKR